ncbi:uncharacterized protein LOC113234492 isoform X1 [Hyposmocoma kahamanoa]|uniref:uncharacterized protein LOC113234492 isoform X1 n=1 Tax=Hyposmocoma kahamanoa TaxID=1477025 RepID=UPI000E6D675B|nr:uncharacterized protein LOC113234492 isoform X1 [Hyposmocoma kahamanoa]
MAARTAVCYSEQQTKCLPYLGKDTYQQEEGDHKRETHLQKKQTNNQQYIEVKHVENYTSTISKAREKTKNLKRTPNVSPDRRPFNHDELKKIKERYTFLGRHPNNPSKEKNKRNGIIDETTVKKIEKTDVVRRSGSSSKLRSPDERTRSQNSSKDSGISDRSPAIHHSPKQSTQSQNSSKDSGISGSTKTDIDLMKGIYSNDEDEEFVDAENYEIKTVETPPLKRKAIVRTINNDAKV